MLLTSKAGKRLRLFNKRGASYRNMRFSQTDKREIGRVNHAVK